MSSQPPKKGSAKVKDSEKTKKSDHNELLLKEIMAMGGTEQDLELLKGIDSDSDSEIEGDDAHPKPQNKASKQTKSSQPDVALEVSLFSDRFMPEFKNELSDFMNSLFGSSKMNQQKMQLAAEEDEEDGKAGEGQSDEEGNGRSEDGWETEEEDNDSGDDSMDDLPQELKNIHAQLENRKRKAESGPSSTVSTSSKESKKLKTDQPMTGTTPTKQLKSDKKKGALADIQKQVSAILGSEKAPKKDTKAAAPPKASESATPSATKAKGSLNPTPASSSKKKKPAMAWKLGDGWNKGFEDEDDDVSITNKSKGSIQKNTMKHTKAKSGRK
ncbi:hypothetical protein BGX31_001320 [Mortierella sp. GBA43]|nr:hypothetical protein BGX31_001320 [Mortierella sp. GBA43]